MTGFSTRTCRAIRRNFAPISPLSFIERTAEVYPDRLAVVHGDLRRSWAEVYRRCRQLASALARHGIGKGDTVAVMLPNTPAMVEAHFGVPMAGRGAQCAQYPARCADDRLHARPRRGPRRHRRPRVCAGDATGHRAAHSRAARCW